MIEGARVLAGPPSTKPKREGEDSLSTPRLACNFQTGFATGRAAEGTRGVVLFLWWFFLLSE